jgi:hypothetical protein
MRRRPVDRTSPHFSNPNKESLGIASDITYRICIYEHARCAFCVGDFGLSRVSGGPGVGMPLFGVRWGDASDRVAVGVDNDTAAFAVQTIRRWWREVGRIRYPLAPQLVITADGGGSNGSRVRLWKLELQRLADELDISIEVHHLPPGTSKWNKIEHRLFSFVTQNWRAKPPVSYRVIVELIGATTTQTGLTVRCELDDKSYPMGIVVLDAQMRDLNISHDDFHGEWNYTIAPSSTPANRSG